MKIFYRKSHFKMTTKEKNKLDKLWGQAIHARGNKCELCGREGRLEAHHIFTRSRLTTRWDLDNGILLCSYCHKFSPVCSAHKAPYEFIKWLGEHKGKDWLSKLAQKSNQIFKGTYEEVLTYLLG
jgi:hypothetical protein